MSNNPGTAGASRILLIEDNPGDVELLQLALQNAGVEFDMTTMDDGGAALAYFSRALDSQVELLPALVILDMNLPKCDGLEILAAFGANRHSRAYLWLYSVLLPRLRTAPSSIRCRGHATFASRRILTALWT